MQKSITFYDINKRVLATNSNKKYKNKLNESATKLDQNSRPEDVIRSIKSCCEMSFAQNFDTVISLYESLYENPKASSGHITKAANIICDRGILEITSAADINKNLKNAKSAATKAKANASRKINKVKNKVTDTINKTVSGNNNSNNKNDKGQKTISSKKEEALFNGYDRMIRESEVNAVCHRVIENYNTVSKRFNIDNLIKENIVYNDVYDTVIELCKLIDTYNTRLDTKFNTVIECAFYGLNAFHIPYTKKEILEAAVDYFGCQVGGTDICRSVLEDSLIFNNPEDIPPRAQVIHEEPPEDEEEDGSELTPDTDLVSTRSIVNASDLIGEEIREYTSYILKDDRTLPILQTSIVKEEFDFNKIFDDWKKQNEDNEHKENGLKSLITKLYSNTPEQIIEGVPNLLKYIRALVVIGTCSIHPIVGAVLFIGDQFVKNKVEKTEVQKMLSCFKSEISATKAKINSCKDTEEKSKLQEYQSALEKSYDKIEDHYLDLLNDEDRDKYYSSTSDSYDDASSDETSSNDKDDKDSDDDFNLDDNDFDFDDDDFDFEFVDESASITEGMLNLLIDYNTFSKKSTFPNVNNNFIRSIGLDNMVNIAEFCSKYPDCYGIESVKTLYENYRDDIKSGNAEFKTSLEKYRTKAAIDESLSMLNNPSDDGDKELNIFDCYRNLRNQCEGMQAIQLMVDSEICHSSLLEVSFLNKLKVAGDKLKRAVQDVADKDKKICKDVDSSVDLFMKKATDAMTNDNRESIIKGSLLPSASKIIKMGITSAGLVAIGQPVLAVIGVLGYIGCSKKLEARQRQEIVDDIEVELKMCDKYIDDAERKEDKDALRALYKIQRDLQRQQQRIKFHMKVKAQPVHDIPNAGY